MELTLHVQLTDEQYNSIMEKSFDSIMEEEQVKSALSEIIQSTMKDYIENWFRCNADNAIKRVFNLGAYGWQDGEETALTKKFIVESSEKYKDAIEKEIIKCMQNMVAKAPLEKIVDNVLTRYIIQGVLSGMRLWTEQISIMSSQIQTNFDNLKSVLTNPDILQNTIVVDPTIQTI